MTSILKVTEIQDPTNGNKAIEIDSSGNIHAPGTVVQCQVQTRTIGNTGSDADIESELISSSTLDNAFAMNTVDITPKFSTSKILMQWSGMLLIDGSGSAGGGADIFFTKDDSNILSSGGNRDAVGFLYVSGTNTDVYTQQSCQLSFTAGQTTQMTLKAEVAAYSSNRTVRLTHDGTTTLTVWEIAQ